MKLADVEQIARSLEDVVEVAPHGNRAFAVAGKSFAWSWMERVDPKKARVKNEQVLVVRVRDLVEKELLISGDPSIYFTEPHYDGYAAVLVRLEAIGARELKKVLTAARDLAAAKRVTTRKKRAR